MGMRLTDGARVAGLSSDDGDGEWAPIWRVIRRKMIQRASAIEPVGDETKARHGSMLVLSDESGNRILLFRFEVRALFRRLGLCRCDVCLQTFTEV